MNAPDRLPPLPESQWTQAQRAAALPIIQGPRGALISPFVPLLRSPELMNHAQGMGEYLRYRSALGQRLSEFTILLVARAWTQQVEWAIHAPIAASAGVPQPIIDAIAQGRRPVGMNPQEDAIHAFFTELHQHRSVSDATWQQAVAQFDEQGVMDLVGLIGYYSFLSMVMNTARTAVPPSAAAALPQLP